MAKGKGMQIGTNYASDDVEMDEKRAVGQRLAGQMATDPGDDAGGSGKLAPTPPPKTSHRSGVNPKVDPSTGLGGMLVSGGIGAGGKAGYATAAVGAGLMVLGAKERRKEAHRNAQYEAKLLRIRNQQEQLSNMVTMSQNMRLG